MEWLTICIAMAGALVVLTTRPCWGLAAYLASLMWYPEYLRINIGAEFSAPRIILLVLLARCLADRAVTRRFRWTSLDSLAAACMVVFSAALAMTTPLTAWLTSQAGFVMDTFLVYLAVRLAVADRGSLAFVAKAMGVILVPLAIHGLVEMWTGRSLYVGLGQYCSWAPFKGMFYQERYGLNRAMGPQGECIMFGLNFMAFLPLLWLLRYEGGPWRSLAGVMGLFAILGTLSTISSGPIMATGIVIFGLFLEKARWLVRPLLGLFLLACLGIEVVSNNHFYYVLGDLAMDPESAWYRARLIDVAIQKLPEYWLYGYGHANPGWGPLINGMNWTDGVNDYIVHGILYGIGGVAMYTALQVAAIRRMVRIVRHSRHDWQRSAAWALGCTLAGLMVSFWSVSLFGTMTTIYYILIGLIASLDAQFWPQVAARPRRAVRWPAAARPIFRRPAVADMGELR